MIKEARKLKVSKLFPEDKPGIRYSVPIFQRAFSWKKPQWESLLTDIWDNEVGYFLGTIICIPEANGNKNQQNFTVIDGQQRLISLLLLYSAIHSLLVAYEKSENRSDNSNSHNSKRMKALRRVLVTNSGRFELRIIPQRSGSDRESFEEVMKNSLNQRKCNEKSLIFKAYDYFRIEIGKRAEEADDKYLQNIMRLKQKIDQILMVRIEVITAADAYILFESLNNRGLPLTISDIIKNQILSQIDTHYHDELDKQNDSWDEMIEKLGEPAIQERFFRHYYNAFRLDLPQLYQGVDTGVRNIGRAKLIGFYERLASWINVTICMQELIAKSNLYDCLIHPDNSSLKNCRAGLADLDHIGAAPSYQLLMYLLTTNVKEDEIKKLIDFLVKFFVRRNLTDKPRSRDMDVIFIDQIDLLRHEPGNIDQVIDNLIKKSALKEEFIRGLEGDLYEDNRAACRFILCKIEETNYKGIETLPPLWQRKSTKYLFEIEHVFPQGKNIPQEWVDMIAGGDQKKAKELQEKYVHKLGNLTLTAFNPNLSNNPFKEKRDLVDNGKPAGYNNGLILNEDLKPPQPDWTIDKIKLRTEKLVKQAIELFRFENE